MPSSTATAAPPVGTAQGPPGARAVWAALGAAGDLEDLYEPSRRDPRYGLDPHALEALLSKADAVHGTGVTLSVCVQAAGALPLLHDVRGNETAAALGARARKGRAVLAVAATDSETAGSDLANLETRVDEDAGGLLLQGGKRWIVNALHADHALVLARHRDGGHFTSFTLLLVPLDLPGVRREATGTRMFDGSGLGSLYFDRVRLPTTHRLGGTGRGLAAFSRRISTERLASGLWANALARRTLTETRRLLRSRTVGGAPQEQHPVVRHQLAEALTGQQQLQALCERCCAPAGPATPPVSALTAVLKATGARTLEQVLDTCARFSGAEAFLRDGLQEARAEVAMFGTAGGTTHLLYDLIADHADALLGPRP
ncbi:acyl-CoA dehydrogenase [Streptomyces sp. TRM 70351]|uniref:acyl-CoA dehydrogenase family protein n=1 Tax=Streptomyces sp. TRM 70351 TaxID=3116552 RepID=UPI002E7C19F1|nr:acyl-CoA dehydrogenase [Streptomyces sp. TRM 70351]MEE1927857.1 acyl-CoA dehydrogenase [Streptomyces sp. TRM 70351]